nr:DUF3810 domain-containing protein [uncultured Prevotella sp.]
MTKLLDTLLLKCRRLCKKMKRRHWLLLSLLVLVGIIKWSHQLSYFYTRTVYPVIGSVLSALSGLVPFAVGDIFIALSILWVLFCLRKKATMLKAAEYLLWIYVWFYIAWGLNYTQPNIYLRTGMKPAEVDKDKLREFAYRYADSINLLSEERRVKSEEQESEEWKRRVSDAIQNVYEKMGQREGINAPFNPHPHAKTMVFTPISSMVGVTGSMAPFFCEFTLNGEIRPHDYPAIYAHEYAHFLGIAHEGEANFYSYLACTSSTDKAVKFSGYYHILPHVLNSVFNLLGEKEGEQLINYIRPEIIELAKDDRHYWLSKRSKALSSMQDYVFDLYLKGNHVSEGRKSYSGVVALIMAWGL